MPATVPGCVHTDLLAAGLIPDPYLDENERLLEWIGRTAWRYSTTFRAAAPAPGERVDLVFEGLDTVATVELNGAVLGVDRQHAPQPTGSTSATLLVDGDNELTVDFAARPTPPSRRARTSGRARTSTATPSTRSARWPATSAGTGGPSW